MARPRKKVDTDVLRKLAAIHCTMIEMAQVVGVSVDTLERRFADVIKEGQAQGKMSLRRKQYDVAMGGNVGMLIWLGKQLLNQTDKQEQVIVQPTVTEIERPNGKKVVLGFKGEEE